MSSSLSVRISLLLLPLISLMRLAAQDVGAAKPDPGPIHVPSVDFTVKIRPELVGVHPRIILDPAGLEALRQKVKTPAMQGFYKNFLAGADAIVAEAPPVNPPNTEDPFRGFGEVVPVVALAYLLTNDQKYLDSAHAWINAIVHYPSWAGDEDLAAGHICFGLGVAYDWLYASLSPDDRSAIETSLRTHARLMLQKSVRTAASGEFWGSAYFQNHSWINNGGIAIAGMALYDTNPTEMQDWLNWTRSSFQITYKNFGLDGGNPEGAGYARYGNDRMLLYIESLRSFSGEDLRDMAYLKGATQFQIDNVMPDGHSVITFTDWAPAAHDLSTEPTLFWAAAYFHDGSAEWFRERRRKALKVTDDDIGHERVISPFSLIWMDPTVQPQEPDSKYLAHVYPDLGLAYFRTSWTDDASVVGFFCGPPGGQHVITNAITYKVGTSSFGHYHPAANSFIFWGDRNWIIGAPDGYTHFKATHNENVWQVNDKGQRGEAEWFAAQSYLGVASQAHLANFQNNDQASYVVGEAAPAYDPACNLTSFLRHLVFVKGDKPYIVVYDKLTASAPAVWTAYFHAFEAFQLSDDSFGIEKMNNASGSFFGPGKLSYTTGPLIVPQHPDKKLVQHGNELVVTPDGPTPSTWLVTVVGTQKRPVQVDSTDSTTTVKVGGDSIAWDAQDNVTVNGKSISDNLLPPPLD